MSKAKERNIVAIERTHIEPGYTKEGLSFIQYLAPLFHQRCHRTAQDYWETGWKVQPVNGKAFMLAPDTEQPCFYVEAPFFHGELSTSALGLSACLYATAILAGSEYKEIASYSAQFHCEFYFHALEFNREYEAILAAAL